MKKIIDVAKECGISKNELMGFLRERGINAISATSTLDENELDVVYQFFGMPKSVKKEREKAATAKRILYDAEGKPIKKQYDENGKEIPYKGPVFDENGVQLKIKKAKPVFYDADGNPIKRKLDENGKPIPYEGPIFDENGRRVKIKKKTDSDTEKKVEEDKKEKPVKVKIETDTDENTTKSEASTEKATDSTSVEKTEKPEKVEKGSEEKTEKAEASEPEKPVKKVLGNVFDERKKKEKAAREAQKSGEKRGGADRKGERGERPLRPDRPDRGDRKGQGQAAASPKKDFGGSMKGAFDKDKDADTPARKSFARKNERPSGGSIKSEMGKAISKDQRATAFNERKKEKAGKNKNRDFENEDGLKKPKKKDPNRKGAFIMPKPVAKQEEDPNEIKTIVIPELITIKDLADKLKQNASSIIKKLFMQGKMYSMNSEIPFEEAEEIALGYDCIAEKEQIVDVVEELMKDTEDPEESLKERPPVVCVMGHVDHGKTSILDAIRKTSVTSREAGGITQHIGAYMVEAGGRKITFLDTPGHEAFTAMRLRGAMSTDIAVLVVAADDGVMPQTVEAINHAKAAGVQIVVAINKMDKEAANPDRVMSELSEHELVSEEWGGSTTMVPVSAKTGEGISNLLEMILLTADVMELKANPNRKGRGLVIEAKLDKGRGPVATMLVKKGTLRVGDHIVAGSVYGKVRAMLNENGVNMKEATPSTPVAILGLNGVPNAGDEFVVTETEKEARAIAEAFIAQGKEKLLAETKAKLSLDGLFDQIQAGNVKELNIIVKADVQGSVEAVKTSLSKLSNEEVAVRIIHSGAGNINESDVSLASASNAIIIGFNVKPDNAAKETAEKEKVDLRLYSVIYNAIDDIEAAMNGMLDPVYEEKILGHAEIRQIFKASGIGNIAGSYILDGKAIRGSKVRIYKGEELVHEGELASLKRFKDDAKEVAAGYECGLVFDKFNEFEEGFTVEFYNLEQVPRDRVKKA